MSAYEILVGVTSTITGMLIVGVITVMFADRRDNWK